MITAILDTNVVVQSVMSTSRAAAARTVDAYFEGRFRLVYCPTMVDEWLDVLMLPSMRKRHGMTDDELQEFVASLLVTALQFPGEKKVSVLVTRDLTDTKFLSVAAESSANYLVTNDHRHLLRLKRFQHTAIVTPARFLEDLAKYGAKDGDSHSSKE